MGLLIKLKNGDTSLKSLKFGKDRPGGGDSGKPYIQTPIGDQAENTAIDGDGIIRGGLTAPSRALEDVTRLSKYFFDFKNPNGLLFTAKQNLLSRIATKTEAATGPAYGGFSRSRTVLGQGITSDGFNENNGTINDGIYTPLSTLGQAAVGFTGTHLNKQGLDPTGLFPNASIKKYGDVVFEKNKASRNGEGPVRSIIPFNLIKKEQRASNRLENATLQQSNAEDRAIDELNREASQTDLFTRSRVLPPIPKVSTSLNNAANSFLKKWDEYRNQQAQKKLDRKTNKLQTAEKKALEASANVGQSYEDNFQEVYYDNRLLNLWNSQGLDTTKSYEGQIYNLASGGVLYSYGGGPNSIAGVGKTDIRFSTLNDGVSPVRTGAFRIDPYFKGVDKDTSLPIYEYGKPINRPLIYSLKHIFSNNTVSLLYQQLNNPLVKGEQLFGTKTYLIDKDNKEDIQPWDNNDLIRSNTSFFSEPDNDQIISAAWNYSDFISQDPNRTGQLKQDFRKNISSNQTKTFIAKSPDYLKENLERRVNIGEFNDPGQKGDISNYVLGKRDLGAGKIVLGAVDTINTLPVYKSNSGPLGSGGDGKDALTNDFCKFRFAVLDNDSTLKFYLHFRAYLDGFKDIYKAKYKSLSYVGRGEEFHKYGGFTRDISFGFKVVALSKQELLPMYKKLNFLASSLAPSYTNAGYMGGTMTEVTIGGYLYNQPGIITSINLTAPKETTWEIQVPLKGITEDGTGKASDFTDKSTLELPHMIEVDVSFTPIHNFRVQRQRNGFMRKDDFPFNNLIEDKNIHGPERYINLKEAGIDGYKSISPSEAVQIESRTEGDQNQIPDPESASDEAEAAEAAAAETAALQQLQETFNNFGGTGIPFSL